MQVGKIAIAAFAATIGAGLHSTAAHAQLNVLCSVQVEWCTAAMAAFEKQTGIKVSMTQKGSGESIAQINAEKENPKTDIWFGGTGDPHLQAAEEGLTEPYKSPKLGELHPWAVKQNTDSGGKTVGIYAGALGYGFSSITVPLALLFLSNRVLNPALVLIEVALNAYVLFVNRDALSGVWRRVMGCIVGR